MSLSTIVLPTVSQAVDAFYINSGVVTTPPNVNATNFVNNGTISIFTTLPFSTSNTENFTNRGAMSGAVGWQLDHAPSGAGVRRAAAVVHNHPQGTITSSDSLGLSSQLLIGATNLINEGILSVGELGLMSLRGTNVNLKRGGVQVAPFAGQGTAENTNGTVFLPETAIIDNYAGIGTNIIDTSDILTQVVIGNTTNYLAAGPTAFGTFAFPAIPYVNITNRPPLNLNITNSTGQVTNMPLVTNWIVQAAFVSVSSTNVGTRARFYPSVIPTNLFQTIVVEVSTTLNNPVTTLADTLTLYVSDRLASATNLVMSTNNTVQPRTYKPSAYRVSRVQPIEFAFGTAPNAVVTNDLLYKPNFTNAFAPARWVGYGFTADKLSGVQPVIPGASITNIAGRIEINAGSLNLERTRFRSDGLVTVRGKHLVSSTNANMDAFNLNFDLGSTNGTLRIQSLAKQSVSRFGGDVQLWSGSWSNTQVLIITNNFAPDTNVPPNYVVSPITNIINYDYHVMIMNADGVALPTPVTTFGFIARGTNVFLGDSLLITNNFYTDAQKLTIEAPGGGISLTGGLPNWAVGNSPNLRYFTNSGNITVQNEARFGYDPVAIVTPLTTFVNRSNITAAGIYARSAYFENAGSLSSGTLLYVDTVSGRMENGTSDTGGDLNVKASDFKLRNYTNQTAGAVIFSITNTLYDNGSTGPNRVVCGDGFHAQIASGNGKPTSGDLLGTSLETAAPIFASIDHTWPGDDRGVSTSGYSNNMAVGRLVLSVGFDAELAFYGTGTSNALYVDYLQFAGVGIDDVDTAIYTDPNIVIYFADSNLPAEELDGKLGGHLRWVKSYAGAYSSVDLLVNGQVTKVNRALRQSLILDSDGDGLANGFDASPFDPAVLSLSVTASSPLTLNLGWNAAANTIYKIEYTTNQTQSWQLLKNYTNNAPNAGPASVLDVIPPGSPQRYYRVGYQP